MLSEQWVQLIKLKISYISKYNVLGMKSFFFLPFFCLLILNLSCSSDDGTPTPDNDVEDEENLLIGVYNGVAFTASVSSGIVENKLSGTLTFEEDGTYKSTVSPFYLNSESGTYDYEKDDKRIIFNEGETVEEIAENVMLKDDSLFFRINRGEENNLTTIDFTLVKQE